MVGWRDCKQTGWMERVTSLGYKQNELTRYMLISRIRVPDQTNKTAWRPYLLHPTPDEANKTAWRPYLLHPTPDQANKTAWRPYLSHSSPRPDQ